MYNPGIQSKGDDFSDEDDTLLIYQLNKPPESIQNNFSSNVEEG